MTLNRDDINIDNSPETIPLQSAAADVTLVPLPGNVPGQVRSVGGLYGPDILFASPADALVFVAAGSTITISLAASLDVATSYKIGGTKVVGAREAGWTAGTGTANKGAFATYAGQAVSAAYVQAEAQATDDAVKAQSQRIKALEDCLRAHGLIN